MDCPYCGHDVYYHRCSSKGPCWGGEETDCKCAWRRDVLLYRFSRKWNVAHITHQDLREADPKWRDVHYADDCKYIGNNNYEFYCGSVHKSFQRWDVAWVTEILDDGTEILVPRDD